MGLQLIFVVETNRKCQSDWKYIKSVLEHFYTYERAHVKLSPVYMNGRGKYEDKEKEVKELIKQYSVTAKNNRSKVLYCFDCDQYDSRVEDAEFLDKAQRFCKERGYEYVWFCRDIESVFLGEKVFDKQKKKRSDMFLAKNQIEKVDKKQLMAVTYGINRSNLMSVLDKFIPPLAYKS